MEFSALTNTGHTLCGNNNNVINSDGISIEYLVRDGQLLWPWIIFINCEWSRISCLTLSNIFDALSTYHKLFDKCKECIIQQMGRRDWSIDRTIELLLW